jgi:hypothetical protein
MLILNSRFAAETFDLNHYFGLGPKRGHATDTMLLTKQVNISSEVK